MKILIVDDEEMMREVVKETIASMPELEVVSVHTAVNGKEGLEIFFKEKPELVITDMMMPVMNGADFVDQMRKSGERVSILVMTGYADMDMAASLIKQNVADMLRKPFRVQEMMAVLNRIVSGIKAQAEIDEMRRRMLESEKLASVGLLAAGVAHEINNPNTFIKGNLELITKYLAIVQPLLAKLIDDPSSNTPQAKLATEGLEKAIKGAISGSERIKKITSSLLSFSRNGSGKTAEVDPAAALEQALTLVSFRTKHHKIDIEAPEHMKKIRANEQELVQAVMNLIVNAVDAIEEHLPQGKAGVVTFAIREREGWTDLVVGDNGKGMSPEVRDKIFQPFFTTKPVGKGTGLGLPIVKGSVEAMGGVLSCESEIGKGTTFTISLKQI